MFAEENYLQPEETISVIDAIHRSISFFMQNDPSMTAKRAIQTIEQLLVNNQIELTDEIKNTIRAECHRAYPTPITPSLIDTYLRGIEYVKENYICKDIPEEDGGVQIQLPVESVRSHLIRLIPYGKDWTVSERMKRPKFKEDLVLYGRLPEEIEISVKPGHMLLEIPKDNWAPINGVKFSFLAHPETGKPVKQQVWEVPLLNLGVIDSQEFSLNSDGTPNVYSPLMLPMTHTLIGAGSGGGKTLTNEWIIYQLHRRYVPGGIEIAIIDFESGDLNVFDGSPLVIGGKVIDTIEGAIELLEYLNDERRKRKQEYKQLSKETGEDIRTIGAYNKFAANNGLPIHPWRVTIIDECSTPLENETILKLTKEKVRFGRKYGDIGVLSTQRPSHEVVSSQIKANCKCKIVMRTETEGDSKVILGGNDDRGYHLMGKGHAIVRADGINERIQVYYLPEGESKSMVKDLRDKYEARGLDSTPPVIPSRDPLPELSVPETPKVSSNILDDINSLLSAPADDEDFF